MATEEEKKRNLARINAMIIYGLEKGLWNLLGESALALSATVGAGMLEQMEQTMGLEIAGEDPQDILTEIGRIFVDEIGIATRFDITQDGDDVKFTVENCVLLKVEQDLIATGVQPFMCPYLNISAAAMRQRLELKTRISEIRVDFDSHRCDLCFE
ncbi:MAG TPA: hypothetical protein ENJ31_03070, partial [Anaerolineae bacterium]|nr:hypothetical protein [Anaerolineae bacterium]